jgi:hypothetical protein
MDIDKQQAIEFVDAAKVTMGKLNDVLDRIKRLLDWVLLKVGSTQ